MSAGGAMVGAEGTRLNGTGDGNWPGAGLWCWGGRVVVCVGV